jgi:hypothetical protein
MNIPEKYRMLKNSPTPPPPPLKRISSSRLKRHWVHWRYRTTSSCARASSSFSFIVVAFVITISDHPAKSSGIGNCSEVRFILISMTPLEYAWGFLIMNSLLLVCFLKFKQLWGSGWFQLDNSLIQVSYLIPDCMRWLFQKSRPYMVSCCPFHLLLLRHYSDTPFTWLLYMTCPPLGYIWFT